jgi:hypothetical protein
MAGIDLAMRRLAAAITASAGSIACSSPSRALCPLLAKPMARPLGDDAAKTMDVGLRTQLSRTRRGLESGINPSILGLSPRPVVAPILR